MTAATRQCAPDALDDLAASKARENRAQFQAAVSSELARLADKLGVPVAELHGEADRMRSAWLVRASERAWQQLEKETSPPTAANSTPPFPVAHKSEHGTRRTSRSRPVHRSGSRRQSSKSGEDDPGEPSGAP